MRNPQALLTVLVTLAALLACGGAGESVVSADAGQAPSAAPAAEIAETLDKEHVSIPLPEGWEVMTDDYDRMGVMILSQKGTGGKQSVNVKVQKAGYTGDPVKDIEIFAEKQGGTAEVVTRNGIEWARTQYSYAGIDQSLNLAKNGEVRVSYTVMGDDYGVDPGVTAIFDGTAMK